MTSPNISRQLNNKEQELLNSHQEQLQIKIKRINKIIKSASAYGGYVCGQYMREVLVPLSKQHKVTSLTDRVSLRFKTHEQFMSFLCDKNILITSVDQTPWNEPQYNVYIKGSRNDGVRYEITISLHGLIADVDVNQLIAAIDYENDIVFDCSDDSLTIPTLIQNIIEKRVKIRSICYKEAILSNIVNHVLQRSIEQYISKGWIVDQSEMPDGYQAPDLTD